MSDIDRVQAQINSTLFSSKAALARGLSLVSESREVGTATLAELESQGDRLRLMEQRLAHLTEEQLRAERHLEELNMCCGLCTLPWHRSKKLRSMHEYREAYGKRDAEILQLKEGIVSARGSSARGTASSAANGSTGTSQQGILDHPLEDDIQDLLGDVSRELSTLKVIASEMDRSLQTQDDAIARLQAQMRFNVAAVEKNERVAHHILIRS